MPTGSCLLVQAYYVWMENDQFNPVWVKCVFTVYAFTYAAIDAYGINFMLTNLAAGDPPSDHVITVRWAPFIAVISTHLNQWLFGVLSPMKYRPLAFEFITSDEASTDTADMQPTASDPSKVEGNSFNFKFAPRPILGVVAVIMVAVEFLAKYINVLVKPDKVIEGVLVKDFTAKQHIETLPGAAVVAVLWVVAVGLLFIHGTLASGPQAWTGSVPLTACLCAARQPTRSTCTRSSSMLNRKLSPS